MKIKIEMRLERENKNGILEVSYYLRNRLIQHT